MSFKQLLGGFVVCAFVVGTAPRSEAAGCTGGCLDTGCPADGACYTYSCQASNCKCLKSPKTGADCSTPGGCYSSATCDGNFSCVPNTNGQACTNGITDPQCQTGVCSGGSCGIVGINEGVGCTSKSHDNQCQQAVCRSATCTVENLSGPCQAAGTDPYCQYASCSSGACTISNYADGSAGANNSCNSSGRDQCQSWACGSGHCTGTSKNIMCTMPPNNPACYGMPPGQCNSSTGMCGYTPIAGKTCADDGNQCTSKMCDVNGKCPVFMAGAGCDDHNPCTLNDACSDPTLAGGLKGCVGNATAAKGMTCNTNPCQQHQTCDGQGNCTGAPVVDGTNCSITGCSNGSCVAGQCSCGVDMSPAENAVDMAAGTGSDDQGGSVVGGGSDAGTQPKKAGGCSIGGRPANGTGLLMLQLAPAAK